MINPTRTRILAEAAELFHKYGIRSITMDEVARQVAISKKTLYLLFENKDELVYQVAQEHISQDCARWDAIEHLAAGNALEMMLQLTQLLCKEVGDLNPSLIYDLQRFHPRAWALFTQQKEAVFEATLRANLERGMREGYYRADIDPAVMARLRFELVKMGFDQSIFPQEHYHFASLQAQLLEHFVRGLLTPAGTQAWDALKARNPVVA